MAEGQAQDTGTEAPADGGNGGSGPDDLISGGTPDAGGEGGDAQAGGDEGGAEDLITAGDSDGGQPEGGQQESSGDDGDQQGPSGAPDEYEPFTVPDGLEFPDADRAAANEVFKELGLDQNQAQALINLQSQLALQAEAGRRDSLKALKTHWGKEIALDADLGGPNLPASKATVTSAIVALGDEGGELLAALQEYHLASEPRIFKALHKIGLAIGEDTISDPSDAGGTPKEREAWRGFYKGMDKAAG